MVKIAIQISRGTEKYCRMQGKCYWEWINSNVSIEKSCKDIENCILLCKFRYSYQIPECLTKKTSRLSLK